MGTLQDAVPDPVTDPASPPVTGPGPGQEARDLPDATTVPPPTTAGRGAGLRYVLTRVLLIPVSTFVVLSLSFFFVNLVPSDPVRAMLGNFATEEEVARINAELGLDQPLFVRFLDYLGGLFSGSLGSSYYTSAPVLDEIGRRFVPTLLLVVLGFAVAWLLGVLLAVVMATGPRPVGRGVSGLVSLLQAVPDFVIGLVGSLVLFFALGLLPAPVGQLPLGVLPPETVTGSLLVDGLLAGQWDAVEGGLTQLVLPVLALGLSNCVIFARTMGATLRDMLDGKASEYARSLGLRRRSVIVLAMRASLLPTIAVSGLVLAHLFGGVAIIEQVFNWQGLGQWGVEGVLRSDLPVAQGFVVVVATMAMLAYFTADLVMFAADPRVRHQRLTQVAARSARRARRVRALRARLGPATGRRTS